MQAGKRVIVAGSANVDFVVRAASIPRVGETVLGGDLSATPGGKGANQAVASARAGGAATVMVAALGGDTFASLVRESLETAGVELRETSSSKATGAALITVAEGGANAITVAPGANEDLSPDALPDLAGAGWLVMQLETPLATVSAFARAARSAGVKVLLNAAPARELPEALLGDIDVLVVNEEELVALSGADGSIAERLSGTGVGCSVVTLGARGCCALFEGRYCVQPAFTVSSVDTTAAGDTFCGVLAAGLNGDLAFPAALRRASAAAAIATTRPGAQASIPDLSEVDDLLNARQEAGHDDLLDYCGLTPNKHGV